MAKTTQKTPAKRPAAAGTGAAEGMEEFIQLLKQQVGNEAVVLDEPQRALYSQDIYALGEPVPVIVCPSNAEELSAAVRLACERGIPVLPRGGGMSYTKGYLSSGGGALLVSMEKMNAVVQVDRENMTVRVQAGCSWEKLHRELAPLKMHTPYWGTLSGHRATVGGSLSNNSIFWGSGRHGSAVDSVLGLQLVLAGGEIVRTGAGAQVNSDLSL